MGDIAKFHLKEDTGTETPRLLVCEKSNGTYMDCPPGKQEDASQWILTIFNPSLQTRWLVKAKINHPHWQVFGWDTASASWVVVVAEAICEETILQTSGRVFDCDLYVVKQTRSLEYTYIKLVFDDLQDISI